MRNKPSSWRRESNARPLNEKFIPITSLAVATMFVVVFSLAGEADIQEQQAQQDRYCEMVTSGAWPDYNGNFKSMCQEAREESTDER